MKAVNLDRRLIGIKKIGINLLETCGMGSNDPKLRAEDVEWAYQHFFNRLPESQNVVQYHLDHAVNLKTLVKNITNSQEYEYKKYNHIQSHEAKPELYYFFHIHKTGGMSVHEYLRDATPQGELMPGFFKQDILNIGSSQAFRYYSGHFGRIPLMLKGKRLRMCTLLRDPVQRGFSHYNHARRSKDLELSNSKNGIFDEKIIRDILDCSLEEFLFSPSASLVFGNHQACQLAELTGSLTLLIQKSIGKMVTEEELYDLAMEGLSKMELVGTTQKLNEFIARLADKWDLSKPIKQYVVNTNPNRETYNFSEHENVRIRELCNVDLKIYEYVNRFICD